MISHDANGPFNLLLTADGSIEVDDYPVRGICGLIEANDMGLEFRTAISLHKFARIFLAWGARVVKERFLEEMKRTPLPAVLRLV